MILTLEEIRLIQGVINKDYCFGYNPIKDKEIKQLQAKLSMMAEAKIRVAEQMKNDLGGER